MCRIYIAGFAYWIYKCYLTDLTLTGPCVANMFSEYNQQDAKFLNLFISVRRSTCFRRVFRPSSGAQNCTYGVRHLSDQYCCLLLAVQSSSRQQYWSGLRMVPCDSRRTAPSVPYTRPTQRLSRPPPIQKLGAENHMLQLNIKCS